MQFLTSFLTFQNLVIFEPLVAVLKLDLQDLLNVPIRIIASSVINSGPPLSLVQSLYIKHFNTRLALDESEF